MKIQTIDNKTNKPLLNSKIQLQVRGKDSGYLSATSDGSGSFQLDDKYSGQQITSVINGTPGEWIAATDNATLKVNYTQATTGSKQPAGTTHNK